MVLWIQYILRNVRGSLEQVSLHSKHSKLFEWLRFVAFPVKRLGPLHGRKWVPLSRIGNVGLHCSCRASTCDVRPLYYTSSRYNPELYPKMVSFGNKRRSAEWRYRGEAYMAPKSLYATIALRIRNCGRTSTYLVEKLILEVRHQPSRLYSLHCVAFPLFEIRTSRPS